MSETFVALDFETTGLSPNEGARTTEVAAILVKNGQIKERFQKLMNPGIKIPPFIQELTGITNQMIAKAPSNSEAIFELNDFIKNYPIVAHNASFDKKFLDAELTRIGLVSKVPVACSLLLSRRVYQQFPNHQLSTLVKNLNLKVVGKFHRALADAEMTANLWLRMQKDLSTIHGLENTSFELMQKFGKLPKKSFNLKFKTNQKNLRENSFA